MAVDLRGVFLCTKHQVRAMLALGGGRSTGGTLEGRRRVIEQEPIGRMGTRQEIADTVVWLCSDQAAFVVGHAMVADDGQTV